MSLCYGDTFNLKYLEKLLNILNMAASMSVENLENYVNDPDSQEFCKNLRDELLEQFNTILMSIGESQSAQLKIFFQSSLQSVCQFV